jgi:ketosteroid isomerase-like protein
MDLFGKNKDLKAITKKFFAAYNSHDVDGMLALCADGAQGRYLPYGKNSFMPIRGGLEKIWRGFPQAVPDFGLGGTMPADVPGVVKKGEVNRIAHAYIIRYNAKGRISRLDCYWDNTAINAIKASAL